MEVIARIHQDTPWLVNEKVAKDPYVPTSMKILNVITKQVSTYEWMEAEKAREKGFKVDPYVPDSQQIQVEWVNDVNEETECWETRLKFRGRYVNVSVCDDSNDREIVHPREKRICAIRYELAEVAKNPLNFIRSTRLLEEIRKETKHWSTHDMTGSNIGPLVLVLLGAGGDANENIAVREEFYIKRDDHTQMTLIDEKDNEITMIFEPGVREKCLTTRFTLFVPGNVKIHDSTTNKLLI